MMNYSNKEIRKQKSSQAYVEQHHDVMENGLYYGQWFGNKGKAVKLICDNAKKKRKKDRVC